MKKRIILTSVLSIAMCLSLIVGATMAFFGSESKANISVTGANVNVVASIDPATGFTTYSNGKTSEELGYPNGEFENGGTASIDEEGALVLNAISAGDSVKVRVDIYNDSNIRIQYRARVVCEEGEEFLELFEIENDIRHMAWQIAEIGNDLKDEIVEVTIGLPEDVNLEDFEGQTIKFAIVVEAVQANAETTDDVIVYEPEEGNTPADNGADLQNIMASGLEAGASVYLGAGEYAIESALTIPNGVSLYGVQRGNAAETWANDENAEKTIITLTQDSDEVLTVTNSGTIIDGIMVNGGTEFYTKGIFVQGSETLTGIEIRNSAVVECANDGISVQNTDGAVIENCYVDTVYDCGIVLENYSNSDGVTAYIRDNVVKNVGRLWTANGSQNGAIAVRGNDDFGCKGDVVVSGNTVENVLSTANDLGTSAIVVEKIHGGGVVTIADNTVKNVSQGISVYKFCSVADADKVVISGNAIENADNFGIATGTLNFYETPVIDTVEITGNTFTGKVPANGNVYLEQTNRYNETTVDWLVIVNGVEFTDETVDANLSLISTAAELSALAGKVNAGDAYSGKTVALVSDIDLSEVEWAPMNTFSGTFDGNGFTISGIELNNTAETAGYYGGLFVVLSGATVQDVEIKADIATGGWAGILAGLVDANSNVTGVITRGSVIGTGESTSVAGLCEYVRSSTISGCVNYADVTSNDVFDDGSNDPEGEIKVSQYAAGIACEVAGSTISGCRNEGDITATPKEGHLGGTYIGGIAAYIKNGSTLSICTNSGKIEITSGYYGEAGGIVGSVWFESAALQTVSACTNSGAVSVTSSDAYAGGIAGTAYAAAVVGYLDEEKEQPIYGGCDVVFENNTNTETGVITITPEADYESYNVPAAGGIIGWVAQFVAEDGTLSFRTEGTNVSNAPMPTNATEARESELDDVIGMFATVTYDMDNTLSISDAESLFAFAATVAGGDDFQGKIVVLTDDIDLSGQTWTPIDDFYGTFDGAGHTISNLTVEGNENYAGLFGDCRKGTESGGGMHHLTIRNLTLSNAKISGNESVAAVVAASSNVTIENVTVQNSVINGQKYVGGILGYSYGNGTPSIAECKAIGVTLSIGETGGAIVGFLEHGSINDCLVQDCTLSGTENIGCVAGRFSSGDHGVVTYDNLAIANTTINGAEADNIWGEHLGI